MGRLCERPGCSEPASVAYGMRAEDLVFWLDTFRDVPSVDAGVLCQRHADTMVVPRNWTLDDLRDPDLHLFRPPSVEGGTRPRAKRGSGSAPSEVEQLELGVEPVSSTDSGHLPSGETDEPTTPTSGGVDVEPPSDVDHSTPAAHETATGQDDTDRGDAEQDDNWTPSFDSDDDLDGLLLAQSPLLARAFRGDDRPRS